MNLVKVLNSRVIRLFPVMVEGGKVVNPALLARGIEARYGFMQGPRTIPEYDVGNGIVFQGGLFGGKTAIEKFTIYKDGVVCDLSDDTSIADSFIDDVVAWVCDEHSLASPAPERMLRGYVSAIDVQMGVDTSAAFPGFDALCRRIVDTIRSYGQHAPNFKPTLFGFHGDATTLPTKVGPPSFSVERREGQSYDNRRYFSKAPLTTTHHLELLSELESLLLSMTND